MGGGDTRVREPESQLALAERAAMDLRRYGGTFVELENSLMDSTNRMFDTFAYNDVMGQAATRSDAVYERGLADFNNAAFQRGLDPSSGAYIAESEALREAQARSRGGAMADSGITNTDQGLAGLANIVQMGQGRETEAMQAQASLARDQLSDITSRAQNQFSRNSSISGAYGTGLGMTAGYALDNQGLYG